MVATTSADGHARTTSLVSELRAGGNLGRLHLLLKDAQQTKGNWDRVADSGRCEVKASRTDATWGDGGMFRYQTRTLATAIRLTGSPKVQRLGSRFDHPLEVRGSSIRSESVMELEYVEIEIDEAVHPFGKELA